ncbi:MAG: hypothetical protein FWC61_02495 [Proteobacteria bacterium]|nr:hypothetical protein [Pseudomonadota bacterium]
MARQIFAPQKARFFGFRKTAALLVAVMFPLGGHSAGQLQTIYTETPVQSYHASPNDVNFVPETQFMNRADSLDYDDNIQKARSAEQLMNPGVAFGDRPAVICRDFGCTRLNDRITRSFLFNSLANQFMVNTRSRVFICEADPFTRSCLQGGITFPVRAGAANALIKIPTATISQVNLSPGLSRASIGITYDLLVNGISMRCEPTVMEVVVPSNSTATLANREFQCTVTSDGRTNVSLLINIDYIDLDYGIMGGYYSLGLQGPTVGGGTGYALFKTAYTNKGMRMDANAPGGGAGLGAGDRNGLGNENGLQVIQPGEYAVEPMQK